ncbi:MAG: hypothetical protein U1F66_03230 [bacterium]
MSANSRRRFLMSLMIPLTMGACAKAPESEQAAKAFMEAYYVKLDPKAAQGLSSGLAAEKLNHQVQLLQGVAPDPASDKPKVEFRLASKGPAADNEASYIYEVHSNAEDIGGRKVFVKLRQDGGKWSVSQFTEEFQGMPQAPQAAPQATP